MQTLAYIPGGQCDCDISGRGLSGRNSQMWRGEVERDYAGVMLHPACHQRDAIEAAYTSAGVKVIEWNLPPKAKRPSDTSSALRDGAWTGEDVVIVGGGPSLRGFDWHRLQDFPCRVIAVNRAYETTRPGVVFGIDNQFFQWAEEGRFGEESKRQWLALDCPIVTATQRGCGNRYVYLQGHKHGTPGDTIADGVHHGGNSGLGAIHLAALLGARRVFLLGFDCLPTSSGKTDHWHDGYNDNQHDDTYERMCRQFNAAADALKGKTEIINCNHESGLRCFDCGDLPDAPLVVEPHDLPVIATLVTPDYEPILERYLRPSVDALGLDMEVIRFESTGDWTKNCARKADAIAKARRKHRARGVAWVDADAKIERLPVLLAGLRESGIDVAAHRLPSGELLGGTVYVGATKKAARVLTDWQKRCKAAPTKYEMADQRHLDDAIQAAKGLRFEALPDSYCRIFDNGQQKSEHPAIRHFQESRNMRRR